MKLIRAIIVFAFFAISSSSSHAAILSYSKNVGLLNDGDFGKYQNFYQGENYVSETLSGSLAKNSILTITYTLTDALQTSVTASAFKLFSWLSYGSDYDDGSGIDHSSNGTNNPLLTTVANVIDPNHGSVVISNLTAKKVGFVSLIVSHLYGDSSSIITSYEVTSVPLPAALPLFGLGIAALAGARVRRKKTNV